MYSNKKSVSVVRVSDRSVNPEARGFVLGPELQRIARPRNEATPNLEFNLSRQLRIFQDVDHLVGVFVIEL
jgi:hypothetical protein